MVWEGLSAKALQRHQNTLFFFQLHNEINWTSLGHVTTEHESPFPETDGLVNPLFSIVPSYCTYVNPAAAEL